MHKGTKDTTYAKLMVSFIKGSLIFTKITQIKSLCSLPSLFLCVKQSVQTLIQLNNSEKMSVNQQSTCRKVLSVLSFMLLLQIANAQYDFNGIEKKLAAAKDDIGKNFVCLIYKDGKIVYKKDV